MVFIRYWPPILEAAIIFILAFVIPLSRPEISGFATILNALGGLAFSFPLTHTWTIYQMPVLRISAVEQKDFDIGFILETVSFSWTYRANRIVIENAGRSAAKNCKGWIVINGTKERVAWTVQKERPNATINASDSERLDFCAYFVSGPSPFARTRASALEPIPARVSPTEEGWMGDPFRNRDVTELAQCKVLITCDNAGPVNAAVTFGVGNITLTH